MLGAGEFTLLATAESPHDRARAAAIYGHLTPAERVQAEAEYTRLFYDESAVVVAAAAESFVLLSEATRDELALRMVRQSFHFLASQFLCLEPPGVLLWDVISLSSCHPLINLEDNPHTCLTSTARALLTSPIDRCADGAVGCGGERGAGGGSQGDPDADEGRVGDAAAAGAAVAADPPPKHSDHPHGPAVRSLFFPFLPFRSASLI